MATIIGERLIASRLNKIMEEKNINQAELAEMSGVTAASISGYRSGKFKPGTKNLTAISKALNVSPAWLIGAEDDPNPKAPRAAIEAGTATNMGAVRIPVLSEIAAGIPIEAMESYIDDSDPNTWEEIPKEWTAGGKEYFALRVSGCSMEPQIPDGAIAIIEKCYEWHNGKIMAVYVNGYNATLKRIRIKENGIVMLEANNTKEYETTVFTPEEVENLPVRPCGILRQIRITNF